MDFEWTPGTGLSNPDIANPVLMLTSDMEYVLTVTTIEGCIASDTIKLRAVKGPAIYVPTAFTPNNDNRNDILRPVYVGIKKLNRFTVFNRWGQLIFSTTDMLKGWDGTLQGKFANTGTYVWFITATNYLDQPINIRGTVTIIK